MTTVSPVRPQFAGDTSDRLRRAQARCYNTPYNVGYARGGGTLASAVELTSGHGIFHMLLAFVCVYGAARLGTAGFNGIFSPKKTLEVPSELKQAGVTGISIYTQGHKTVVQTTHADGKESLVTLPGKKWDEDDLLAEVGEMFTIPNTLEKSLKRRGATNIETTIGEDGAVTTSAELPNYGPIEIVEHADGLPDLDDPDADEEP